MEDKAEKTPEEMGAETQGSNAPEAAQTMETQSVEEATAKYAGETPEDQTKETQEPSAEGGEPSDDAQSQDSQVDETGASDESETNTQEPLSTENAPAFQETEEAVAPSKPIELPADPDGSKMVGLTREALRNLIPHEKNGAIHDLLSKVAADETTTRAVSVLLGRVLAHEGAYQVNLKVLGDCLQGDEAKHFVDHGLGEGDLLEVFGKVTPEAIRLVAA